MKGFTRQNFAKYIYLQIAEAKLAKQNAAGFIALITVIIILAITLLIGLGFSLITISEAQMALQKNQSSQAYFLAYLCSEQALMKLKEDSNYTGDETLNLADGNCQILPIEGKWIVKTIGNFKNQVKKIRVSIAQVNPQMIISSWQEVADF